MKWGEYVACTESSKVTSTTWDVNSPSNNTEIAALWH